MRIGQSRGFAATDSKRVEARQVGNGFYTNDGAVYHAGYRECDYRQSGGYREPYPKRNIVCHTAQPQNRRDENSFRNGVRVDRSLPENVEKAMMSEVPECGGIYLVEFGEDRNHCLITGKRPAICISGDSYNENSPIVRVVPMTKQFKSIDAKYHVFVDRNKCAGLRESGMALGEQSRPIDRTMIEKKIGIVADEALFNEIARAAEAIVESYK